MKKTLSAALIISAIGSAASAHPTGIPFDTRGDCESAYAASSKLDRARLLSLGLVESQGAAQKTFNETFRCEYDEEKGAWYIIFLGFPGGN